MDDRFETNPDAVKAFHDRVLARTREAAQSLHLRVAEVTQRFDGGPDGGGESAMENAGSQPPQDDHQPMVLVVEDNRDQAESLAMVLRLWGFQPAIAPDGATALDIAARERPDAILADIGLPGGMDGFELAQRLRQRPELRDVPIAAVTAYTDEKSRCRSQEVGLVKHFGKPADLVALHRLLDDRRDQLQRRRAEEALQRATAEAARAAASGMQGDGGEVAGE
jgi:CheY-like chemotaxis protein